MWPPARVRDIAQYTDGLTISGGATYQARISLSPDGRAWPPPRGIAERPLAAGGLSRAPPLVAALAVT